MLNDEYDIAARRSAFTLIELLVVIAIISLLVSILLPSLQRARDMATDVMCKSNLRGLGLAVRMYADDYAGALPQGFPYSDHWPNRWHDWSGLVPNYIENPPGPNSILKCPAEPVTDGGYGGVTYSMNMPLMGRKLDDQPIYAPVSWANPDNSKVVVWVDSRPSCPSMNIWGGNGPAEVERDRGARHRGGDNVLFGDLHVGWIEHIRYPGVGGEYSWL